MCAHQRHSKLRGMMVAIEVSRSSR